MDKLQFLDALKRAMTGLPPEAQAKTLAFYEQRFVDGVALGRTEQDIASEQDDPKKIAMTLRANTHMKAFETKKNPATFLRMLFAGMGLAIFNLFMVVPAMVYAALLAALYACGLAFYLAGAVITASGLSGNNEIALNGPLRQLLADADINFDGDGRQTKVDISESGVRVFSEPATDGKRATTVTVGPDSSADGAASATATASASTDDEPAMDDENEAEKRTVRVAKRVESVASNGIVVSTDMDDESRTTQTFLGFAMVLGGIILLLLSLVVTRFTFIGIKRYIDMNISLLKGN